MRSRVSHSLAAPASSLGGKNSKLIVGTRVMVVSSGGGGDTGGGGAAGPPQADGQRLARDRDGRLAGQSGLGSEPRQLGVHEAHPAMLVLVPQLDPLARPELDHNPAPPRSHHSRR